jgi:GNAT superfamily N-acetyltransferase
MPRRSSESSGLPPGSPSKTPTPPRPQTDVEFVDITQAHPDALPAQFVVLLYHIARLQRQNPDDRRITKSAIQQAIRQGEGMPGVRITPQSAGQHLADCQRFVWKSEKSHYLNGEVNTGHKGYTVVATKGIVSWPLSVRVADRLRGGKRVCIREVDSDFALFGVTEDEFQKAVRFLVKHDYAEEVQEGTYIVPTKRIKYEGDYIRRMATLGRQPDDDSTEIPAHGEAALLVSSLLYEPISGAESCFFETFFYAVLAASHKRYRTDLCLTFDPSKDSDFILSLFASPDRVVDHNLTFWQVPIKIGLNAICTDRHLAEVRPIAKVLTRSLARAKVLLKPIVIDGEVGHNHCNHIGYADDELLKVGGNSLNVLAKQLLAEDAHRGDAIPVVVVDEYTALRLLEKLEGRGVNVFPWSHLHARGEVDEPRRSLPEYHCCIAARRDHAPRNREIYEALEVFLRTHMQIVARQWVSLAEQLLDRVYACLAHARVSGSPRVTDGKRWEQALSWVFNAMALAGSVGMSEDWGQWKALLKEAQELFRWRLARRTAMIASIIETPVGGLDADRQRIDRLNRIFDLNLGVNAIDLDPVALLAEIQHAFVGPVEQLPLRFDVVDAWHDVDDASLTVVGEIWASLAQAYERRLPAAAAAIKVDLDALRDGSSIYAGKRGGIVLGRLEGQRDECVGSAAVHVVEHGLCEVRYLWVYGHFQGHRLGRQILRHAVALADSLGSHTVYAEVPELWSIAPEVFHDLGFQPSARRSPFAGPHGQVRVFELRLRSREVVG